MVLLTQHYDTVTAVGAHSESTIMMAPYSPDGMSQVGDQLTSALLATGEMTKPDGSPGAPSRGQRPSVRPQAT